MSVVTRFVPSPTGYLHLGHAHAALVAFGIARERGGHFHMCVSPEITRQNRLGMFSARDASSPQPGA